MQKILFGGPGTGKSYQIGHKILPLLGIEIQSEHCIKTVFHPEYTHGDFMGKLLPITQFGAVKYNYYAGYFMRALAQAYKNILANQQDPQHVALVIDEINRGNSSAIFGTVFQLLDREDDGWSSYEVNVSEMEYAKLLEIIGITYKDDRYQVNADLEKKLQLQKTSFMKDRPKEMQEFNSLILEPMKLLNQKIQIPPNLSIIATMNISDNSIFYMDSAFKRRWEWEFVGLAMNKQIATIEGGIEWGGFIDKLNTFFKSNHRAIRQIEDKQIGYWFIKAQNGEIKREQIRNKLMFFIWDSVFSRDKQPLCELLQVQLNDLVTFGDFSDRVEQFILAVNNYHV